MRSAAFASGFLALALSLSTGVAQAADYVVVKSSDPGFAPGSTLDAGQTVPLGAGQTLVLIANGGDVTMLRGGPGGATPPRPARVDGNRVSTLRAIIEPPPPGHTYGGTRGRTFGSRRGGVCPDAATLETVDDIIAAHAAGCDDAARAALQLLADKASD